MISRNKRSAFLLPFALIIFTAGLIALSVWGFMMYKKMAADPVRPIPVDESSSGKLPSHIFSDSMDGGFDYFVESVQGRFSEIRKNIGSAPLMSEVMLITDKELLPASPWVFVNQGIAELTGDVSGGMPFTRIESAVFNAKGGKESKFSLRWKGRDLAFPGMPQSVKGITTYQKNTGPIPLLVTFVWSSPSLTNLPEWTTFLNGFSPVIAKNRNSETREEEIDGIEFFFSDGKGGKALLKIKNSLVVYADVTFTSDAFETYQKAAGEGGLPLLPARLPENFSLGDWSWRERGMIRPDFVKSSLSDNATTLYSLYQWSIDRKKNDHFVYGLARTWNGYLSDISLWFDRNGWDSVRKDIFSWFGMEDFNFVEMQSPVSKNGIEIMVENVDEKAVVINIRDTKIVQMFTAYSEGWGEGLVHEIRKDWDNRRKEEEAGKTDGTALPEQKK